MNNQKLFKVFDVVCYVLMLASVVLVPLLADRRLTNFFIIPKEYVFVGLTLLAALMFVARVVLSKSLEYRRTFLDKPLLVLLASSLLATVFSVSRWDSFLGRNEFFVLNFMWLVFGVIFFWGIVNFVNTPKRWRLTLDLLTGVGGVVALTFVLKAIFKFDLVGYLAPQSFSTIDKLNSQLGFFLVAMFVIAGGQLIKKQIAVGRSLYYFFVALLSLTALALLSFQVLWWLLLVGLVLMLMVGVNFVSEARLGWLSVLFSVLILTVVFITFGSPKSLQTQVPAEVGLGIGPSWQIARQTVFSGFKPFFLGTGLGTFGVNFSQFRPADFNYDNLAWSLRFNQPFSSLFAIMSEGGLLMTLAFVFLVLIVLGHLLTAWFNKMGAPVALSGNETGMARIDIFLVAITWVVLTIGLGMAFNGPVLWWLWWLMLSLTVAGLAYLSDSAVKVWHFQIEDTPQYSLSFSFGLIVVMAAVVMTGVWGARLYLAEIAYARALNSDNLAQAEAELTGALSQRSSSDMYNTGLAQVYLSQAAAASQKSNPDVQSVSALVARAVNAARVATDLSPKSVGIWENLATMYENAAAIVPDARDWALKSLSTAIALEPSNPVLHWRLGNNYGLAGKWDEAIKEYQASTDLKKDYLDGFSGLANAYEQKGQIDQAVETYKQVMPYSLNSPEALFNFGRLLYNRNKGTDRSDSEKLWLEAVRLQPNYSNALYSLGLMYENRGNNSEALRYYYKVKDLNPGNKDITNKINSLVGGQ